MNFFSSFLRLIGVSSGVLLCVVRSVLAQSDGDSTRHYELMEVVVTGTRLPQGDPKKLPSSVDVIDKGAIEAHCGGGLSSFIEGVSGTVVTSYGGNGIHTASMRGMGSDHTLVLVDGRRFTQFQNGLSDLSIIPVLSIERIEIARGGYSSLYGADAVGGVINLITRKPTEILQGSTESGIGSEGFQELGASLNTGVEEMRFRASLHRESGRNNYQYFYHDGKARSLHEREGADFSFLSASTRVDTKLSPALRSFLSIQYSDMQRGTPSAATSASTASLARLGDKDVFVNAGIESYGNSTSLSSLTSTYHYSYQKYDDPLLRIGSRAISSYYVNRAFSMIPELRFGLSRGHSGEVGGELTVASIRSNEVKAISRTQFSLFVTSQHEFLSPFEIIFYPSIRYDAFSDVAGDISPRLGVNIALMNVPSVRIRSSYTKSYRVPTFNDLYWKSGGNPKLNPERSLNFDAGVAAQFGLAGVAGVEVNYFNIDSRERIVWTPDGDGFWSPHNVNRVQSTGAEVSAEWKSNENTVVLGSSYTLTDARKKNANASDDRTVNKQLPYVPRHMASFHGTFTYGVALLSIRHGFTGVRYVSETNDRRSTMEAFNKTDASIMLKFLFNGYTVKAVVEVRNLFSADYQILEAYPMPLRTYVGKLQMDF